MASPPEEEEERSHSDEEENGGGLPEDQVFELLTRVPLDDLPACRMVSTRWRRLTYEPAFAPLHCRRAAAVSGYLVQSMTHNRYHADFVSMHAGSPAISLDFLPSAHVRVEAVSAHRGLACCRCVDADTARPPCYYVCKPATRQWRALPSPRMRFCTAAVAMVARPSAASTTAAVEFKVVRFSVPALRDRLRCEVFDSRRFAWRRAPDVPLCPDSLFRPAALAVRAHGAMHWLRWPERLTGAQDVFAFDLKAESWRVIELPREVDEMDDPWARKQIAAVEGRLCLLVVTDGAAVDEEVLEVWEMANYGEGRWRKKMTVSLKSLHAKEGPSVILRDLHSSDVAFLHSFCRVMWYDFRKGKMAEVQVKHVCIQEIFKYESDLIPCDIGRASRSPHTNCVF
ncbi:hypothetical protein BDA96_07G188700 [Sorghum bicolor]|uniref:F-box domain-containing protein n=1 Tax=Sorghum bicolor TaxID=4558 RepID=A0A921UB09_SORBI|nr:hypothetical protein BDA96_07G188700 [Sorghum bicolor]